MANKKTKGIYCFIDKETGIVVYIGRFTGKKRIKDHYSPSKYDKQQINRVLQNNSDRYRTEIICEYPDLTNVELNYLEIKEIFKHKFLYDEIPKFNFTIGGEGLSGFSHTEKTKQKLSEVNKDKILTKETKKKISESLSGENHPRWKDYARIIKKGINENGKQIYAIKFNGEILKYSIFSDKLVKWFKEKYPNENIKA